MKIVLDTTILVRAKQRSHGLARELLWNVVESKHTLLLSNEMQTAIIGEADILCTKDSDFFEDPAREYLSNLGIVVLDDISPIHRLRS